MSFKKLATIDNLFFLVIFSLPLYLVRLTFFGWPTNVSELLAVSAILLLLLKKKNYLRAKLLSVPKPVLLSIAFLLVGLLLSILFNTAYAVGFGIFKSWFLIPVLFSYALYTLLISRATVEKMFFSLYLSAALVGIISLIYKISGIVTYDNRLAAFYLSPNYLALYLASGLFFSGYFLLKSFLQKRYSRQFFIHLVLLAAILLPLYYTYSYGAWAALLGAMLITLATAAPRKKYLLTGLFLTIAAVLLVSQTTTPKFSQLTQSSLRSSFASRLMIWDASRLMIRQHPILGIGPGNFQTTYLALQKYFPPYLEWAVPQPHNLFLAFWLQTGLLGLLGFLLLLIFVLRTLMSLIQNKKNAALAAPLLGLFLYTILHGLVDTPYWKNDLAFLFWICVFLTLSLRNVPDFEK